MRPPDNQIIALNVVAGVSYDSRPVGFHVNTLCPGAMQGVLIVECTECTT